MDVCDEGEKKIIGEASYLTLRFIMKALMGIWIVMLILEFVFQIGLVAVIQPVIVFGMIMIGYMWNGMRIQKRGK